MIDFKKPPQLPLASPYVFLATCGGAGFLSPAPGTWGSIVGLISGAVLFNAIGFYGFAIALILFTVIGLWAAEEFDRAANTHDSKMIVIDELVGQWLAMTPVLLLFGTQILWLIISFVLFRAFDIAKPWPISYIDKNIRGAFGVMLDDILAGILAALTIICIYYAGFG